MTTVKMYSLGGAPISSVVQNHIKIGKKIPRKELVGEYASIEEAIDSGARMFKIHSTDIAPHISDDLTTSMVSDLAGRIYVYLRGKLQAGFENIEANELTMSFVEEYNKEGLIFDVEGNLRIHSQKDFLESYKDAYICAIGEALNIVSKNIGIESPHNINRIGKLCWKSVEYAPVADFVNKYRVDPDKIPGAFCPVDFNKKKDNTTSAPSKKPVKKKEHKPAAPSKEELRLEEALALDKEYGHRIIDEVGEGKVFSDNYALSEHLGIVQGYFQERLIEFDEKFPDGSKIHRNQVKEAQDLYNALENSWGNLNLPCLNNLKAAVFRFK